MKRLRDTRVEDSQARVALLLRIVALTFVLPFVVSQAALSQIPPAETLRVEVEAGVVAVLANGLRLEAVPRRAEGLYALTERICGDRSKSEQVAVANDNPSQLLAGVRYRIPWSCATRSWQERALAKLFPGDRPSADGWVHRVGSPRNGYPESLWRMAIWFTGSGKNYAAIRQLNRLADESIEPQQELVIPRALLRSDFVALLPAATEALAAAVSTTGASPIAGASNTTASGARVPRLPRAEQNPLRYGQDSRGRYAGYRLDPGEALYSSVVVRFTGRLLAQDVNPLAHRIAERSDIADLTDIPVGYEVKIPFEYLSQEYLPADDPRRVEYEREAAEAARYTNMVRSEDLRGVTIVLDAGHGGRDVGASKNGIWESVYAYDIMERVRRRLQGHTSAKVLTTTRDGTSGYKIPRRDILPRSREHIVLTTPPYRNDDSKVSANLRWALSNSMLANQQRSGTDESNVVFVSIHADSLHPSVRGAMAYVPGLLPLRSNYRLTSQVYRSREEVREQRPISFKQKERVRSLGLSRELADHVISGLRDGGVRIHSNKPIRDRIIRGRRPWVPAVLKYNRVPAKILVEVCNLANAEDLELIKTQAFREKFAIALVDGIRAYYESGSGARATAGP